MGKLIQKFKGKVIKELALKAGTIPVGRNESNAICLDDPTVSGKHANFIIELSPFIHVEENDVYIEDLNSTNGTLLAGKKVNRELLKHGDIVNIGAHEFCYQDEAKLRLDQTMIIDSISHRINNLTSKQLVLLAVAANIYKIHA